MSQIPEDIQATADKIFNGLAVFDWSQAKTIMACAILAERLRCHGHAGSEDANQKILSGEPANDTQEVKS